MRNFYIYLEFRIVNVNVKYVNARFYHVIKGLIKNLYVYLSVCIRVSLMCTNFIDKCVRIENISIFVYKNLVIIV